MLLKDKEKDIKKKIIQNLKGVFDPELPVNIYDLGLIYEINLKEESNNINCKVLMTLTSPSCPVSDSLLEQVRYFALMVDEVTNVEVELTFEPMWNNEKITAEGKEILEVSGVYL